MVTDGSFSLRGEAAAVDTKLAALIGTGRREEGQREPGMPRQVTAHLSGGLDIRYVTVAGTPPQLIAYYQRLVDAGMRYFIVSCGSDLETLPLFGREQELTRLRQLLDDTLARRGHVVTLSGEAGVGRRG